MCPFIADRARICKRLRSTRIYSKESIPPAGRYDNPIPTRFLAPRHCYKIPVQLLQYTGYESTVGRNIFTIGYQKFYVCLPGEHSKVDQNFNSFTKDPAYALEFLDVCM